jgi:hypothetical protein
MCGTDAPAGAVQCQCGYTFVVAKGAAAPQGATPADATPTVHGDGWQMAGWAFVVAGATALVVAVMMGTSVETYASAAYGGPSEVVNLDLQFKKGLAIAGSLFVIGAGIFCLGVGAIVKALGRKG